MKKIISLLLIISMFLFCSICSAEENETAEPGLSLTFFETGKSDCILIEGEGLTIINDTADDDDFKMIKSALQDKEIETIDYMILSHFDKDHIGSAANIIANFDVKCIIMPDYEEDSDTYETLMDTISQQNIETINTDYDITSGELSIHVSAPEESSYDDANNYSMITSIEYGDTSFLLLGDSEEDRLDEYFNKDNSNAGQYTVVKLPHHGSYSKTLKNVIKDIAPFTAIICDGKDFSLTSDKLLEVLSDQSCDVYTTKDGKIQVTSDGKTVSVVQ